MEYHPSITHQVVDQITGEPDQLPVLLRGGSIVNKQWCQELADRLHLPANMPDSDRQNLEDSCLQPSIDDYFPVFAPNLKRPFQQATLWAPNQNRLKLFKARHFLFLVEGEMISTAWINVVLAGGGTYETFDIHQGTSKWVHQLTLPRGKVADEVIALVLIANEEALDAAVGHRWKDFTREAER